jgi:hypothetical protein
VQHIKSPGNVFCRGFFVNSLYREWAMVNGEYFLRLYNTQNHNRVPLLTIDDVTYKTAPVYLLHPDIF